MARGIDTLDAVMTTCVNELKLFAIAILDLEKAFVNVRHAFIVRCFNELNIPGGIVVYLKYVYSNSRTILSFKGNVSPEQGMWQGDPLSPLLFFIVFNKILEALPRDLGIKFKEIILNHLAFADDLVLLSNSLQELQEIMNVLTTTLATDGLKINSNKTFSLLWVKDAKRKKLIYNSSDNIMVNNQAIKTLQTNDYFTYLGAEFGTTGLMKINSTKFQDDFQTLRAAPCKPQQKLFMLVHFLLPKYYHTFIFSTCCMFLK